MQPIPLLNIHRTRTSFYNLLITSKAETAHCSRQRKTPPKAGFSCFSLGVVVLFTSEMALKNEMDVTRETREGLFDQSWKRMLRETVTSDWSTLLKPGQRPIWLRIPCPVSSSVPKPIMKPSIANRPFQVSAKLLKSNGVWFELVMSLIELWSPTWVRLWLAVISQLQLRCCRELQESWWALGRAFLMPTLSRGRTSHLMSHQQLPLL